jgi:hypothetical protein
MKLFNGTAVFYRIEARNRCWKNPNWHDAVGDHRGHPRGFTASDPVWQRLRVFGTEDLAVAEEALKRFIKAFPETDFRIVKTEVTMSNTVVGEEHLSDNPIVPPTMQPYPTDEHYEHLRRVAEACEFEPASYVMEGSRAWRRSQLAK